MAGVAVKDIGNVAANAFVAGQSVYGANVYAVGGKHVLVLPLGVTFGFADKLTLNDYAATFAKVFGKEFVYDELTTEQVRWF
jgi:hypothetical protein